MQKREYKTRTTGWFIDRRSVWKRECFKISSNVILVLVALCSEPKVQKKSQMTDGRRFHAIDKDGLVECEDRGEGLECFGSWVLDY